MTDDEYICPYEKGYSFKGVLNNQIIKAPEFDDDVMNYSIDRCRSDRIFGNPEFIGYNFLMGRFNSLIEGYLI
jgi:hypothetical protein